MNPLNFTPVRIPEAQQKAVVVHVPDYQPNDEINRIVTTCQRGITWRPAGRGDIESHTLPTDQERRALLARLDQLDTMTARCESTEDRKRAGKAVADMLAGFTMNRRVDGEEARAMVAGIVADLSHFPAWAIERTCNKFRLGKVPGMSFEFAPSSAALCRVAEMELAGLRIEQRNVKEVLALKSRNSGGPDAADERKRIAHQYALLQDQLRNGTPQESGAAQ